METRVALIGIMLKNKNSAERVNVILHEYADFIIGRMGIPYKKANLYIISIVVDAPQDMISALSGKIGLIPGVSTKTVMPKSC